MPLTDPQDIADLLQNARTIALVGASDRPDRASFGVMKFLQDQGYRVIPVNPRITGEHVHGEYIWRELGQIGEPIDIVDIFMRGETVGPIVDDAIAIGAKAVWMQLGVINGEAAAKAEAAGLKVVMDHCPKIEFARLGLSPVSDQAEADATIISGIMTVGLSTPRRSFRSLAGSSVANIVFRFDAMVISATAGPISPLRTRKPAAPRL